MHYSRPDNKITNKPVSKWFYDDFGYKSFWFGLAAQRIRGASKEEAFLRLVGNSNLIALGLWVSWGLLFSTEAWFWPLYDNCSAPSLWPDAPWLYE
uniref:Uncharacterized protein n=1 Tax=Lotharella oceanica TaxID=641309 RepID=A0A140GYQ5_9EUKA|nr:hypothetical protein AN617_64 [Lotharella oceanica]AMN87077.1 hypothetical protein AN617_64 [Lotharella oceanica]